MNKEIFNNLYIFEYKLFINIFFLKYTATQSKLQPSLSNFMRYAKVELAPPSTSDIPAIQKSFANIIARSKNGKYNTLTVKVINI